MRSEVPTTWRCQPLYDLATYVNGRATKPAERVPNGTPVIKIAELSRGIGPSTDRVPASAVREKHWVRDGDLLFAWSGSVGIHVYRGEPAALNQHIFRVVANEGVDQRFLRYLLEAQLPLFSRFVESKRTTMGHVTVADLKATRVAVPPLDEQERIKSILGALDDKIDSNRRRARLLEEIAQAEFQARFVEFVDQTDFVETDLGRAPVGWEVAPIGDVLTVVGGGTPSTKERQYWDGGAHCWATPKDLAGLPSPVILDTARHITDEGVSRISSKLLPERTVLLSSRAPVGYTAMSMVEIAVNQGFIAIPPSDTMPGEYVLFWLRAHLDRIKAHAGGTTFAEISKRAFRPLLMHVPPRAALTEYERLAGPLLDSIAGCEREIRTLAAIRDNLLPKLVSGAIRVPDSADPADTIEPLVEEHAA